ncbi:MAG: SsrA-binding protein SmpB [Patescibacteria group bacterium]|nr:SsrA-binding protein SmpB [Patescibacteria group bacterium]
MTLLENKKARLNYEVLEEYEAGLELEGGEVKALRGKQGNLEGSHAVVRGGQAYLVGMVIPPYQAANTAAHYDPARARRLLLTKKEIAALAGYEGQKGLTIVPLSVYTKGRTIKVRVAVARGRKLYDKREVLKKRDAQREIDRSLKNK